MQNPTTPARGGREARFPEIPEGGVDIVEDPCLGESGEVRHDLVVVAVTEDGVTGPVKEVRGDGPVPRRSQPSGDVLDVLVHAERLLRHDDGGAGLPFGLDVVQAHVSVRRGECHGLGHRASSLIGHR